MFRSLDNKYIYLIWWAVFMLILPWDQEKIVVFNLIVFVYLLNFMLSDTIEAAFNQKKIAISEKLSQTIIVQSSAAKRNIHTLRSTLSVLDNLIFFATKLFYQHQKQNFRSLFFLNFSDKSSILAAEKRIKGYLLLSTNSKFAENLFAFKALNLTK